MTANLVSDLNGEVQFAYNKNRGNTWHTLGTPVEEDLDLVAMMEVAGLNRSITKQDLFIMTSAGITKCETHQAVVLGATDRDRERIVGVNSPKYGIHEPADVFAYGEAIAEVSGACWDTMGLLAEGSRFFGFLRQEPFILDPNGIADKHERGIVVASSFDGTSNSVGFATMVRAVCANTVAAGMAAGERMFAIKHTRFSADRLKAAIVITESAEDYLKAFSEQATKLLAVNDNGKLLRRTLDVLYPLPEVDGRAKTLATSKRGQITDIYASDTCAGAVGHNGWAVYNAVTEYLDHQAQIRLEGDEGTAKEKARELRKAERALFGEQDALKLKVADIILELAGV